MKLFSLKCLVLITALSSTAGETIAKPLIILPLGDSITAGDGAPGGYRTQLFLDLRNTKVDFTFVGSNVSGSKILDDAGQSHHEGHDGFAIGDIEQNLIGARAVGDYDGGHWMDGGHLVYKMFDKDHIEDRTAIYPDIILLHVGTNNIRGWQSAEDCIKELRNLLSKLTTLCPNARIFVSAIIPRLDENEVKNQQYDAAIPALLKEAAFAGKRLIFVDMHAVLQVPGVNAEHPFGNAKAAASDYTDSQHPSQKGYDKMGDAWFQAIKANP